MQWRRDRSLYAWRCSLLKTGYKSYTLWLLFNLMFRSYFTSNIGLSLPKPSASDDTFHSFRCKCHLQHLLSCQRLTLPSYLRWYRNRHLQYVCQAFNNYRSHVSRSTCPSPNDSVCLFHRRCRRYQSFCSAATERGES